MGRGLVRVDVTRCLTRRSDAWALPTRGLSHPWALLLPQALAPVGVPPVSCRTRGRSLLPWALAVVSFAASAPVGAPPVEARTRGSSTRGSSTRGRFHPSALHSPYRGRSLPWGFPSAQVLAPSALAPGGTLLQSALAPVGAGTWRWLLPWALAPVGCRRFRTRGLSHARSEISL